MAQKLFYGILGATGIVGVLFIIGMILYFSGVSQGLGKFTLVAAVSIGVIMGLLGVAGIVKKLFR